MKTNKIKSWQEEKLAGGEAGRRRSWQEEKLAGGKLAGGEVGRRRSGGNRYWNKKGGV